MTDNNKDIDATTAKDAKGSNGKLSELNNIDNLSQYLKSTAGTREGRAIPPLENWHPEQMDDMDLVIKANGEWWHEGGHMTRESLVSLFATILWKEEKKGVTEYFLKTPVQKLRIQVEDAPLLINDVGIVNEDINSWLEFTTTTGDVVRLDDEHPIVLRAYDSVNNSINDNGDENDRSSDTDAAHNSHGEENQQSASEVQIRPYMMVRNGLTALIGRNVFYHLTEIGELTEQDGKTTLTLQSGGNAYTLSMPSI
ncbi:conserved hypothetical protein [Psychrobacter arcticus 273-4]|uniref:Proteophosphoglycan n=1 Tax=Psychrobacter arcticus (strain DSM 17307 / VKM B-2377 / 273-4) TaxID=259536 RepID=Q4FQA5_PSYA2|nr:DUF1285 domain-containing protein [Psychrobacter arcticus]AAZ19803.1 conserved hypothetical protein [Psychrobacter arcticus 273-4]